MSPDDSSIIIGCKVQDWENSSGGATCNLRSIFGEGQTGHNSIIAGLKNVLAEVHLPNPKQLIWASSDAKARTNN